MSPKHPGPLAFFTHDHRRCDELWAELEAGAGAATWTAFDQAMRAHFAMEEDVLFPALEQATGMIDAGPTFVMRSEHQQMKSLLDTMGAAASAGDFDTVLDQGDSLLMLIQQHNMKEEHMLYPLADRAIADQWGAIASKLDAYRSA